MKKNIKFIIPTLFFLLLFVAAITNPKQEFHKSNIKTRVYKELNIDTIPKATNNNIFDYFSEIGNSFGKSMVDNAVDSLLQVDDYYFFSLTKVAYQGQTKIIGIGAFNQIFLFVNLKELIEEQKKQQPY
jgi:hypothetical protein